MKQVLLTVFAALFCLSLHAQMSNGQDTLYGNEWIQYGQPYYKLKIAEDGVYRLTYQQMQAAGIPLNAVQGQRWQLFHLGVEQPVFVSNEGTFQSGDYLEFYGQKNRSELDRHLYRDPNGNMLNPEYSLFTDSAAYYLTLAPTGTTPLHYNTINNDLNQLPAAEPWYWATSLQVFSEGHFKTYRKQSGANIYFSHFEADGFAHNYIEETNFTLSLSARNTSGPKPELNLSMIGNFNSDGHALQLLLNNNLLTQDSFIGPQLKKYFFSLDHALITDQLKLTVRGLNDTDRMAVAFGKIRYPRNFSFAQNEQIAIELPAAAGPRYLALSGLGNQPLILLEPATGLRLITKVEGGLHRVKLPAAAGARFLYLYGPAQNRSIPSIRTLQFTDFENAATDYLILTNDQLYNDGAGNNWVQAYADYRTSAEGGGYEVQLVEVKSLFDQFAYGIDYHPMAIRNAVAFLRRYRLPDLRFLFIIGRGQEYQLVRKPEELQAAVESGNMLVPSFGYPASDNLLFAPIEGRVSPLPLGRLAAINGAEVKIYLDKVRELELAESLPQTIADRAWTKQVLHLGGGSNGGEQSTIRFYLESMADEIEKNTFGGSVKAFYKNSTDVIQNSLSQEIFDYINAGTSIITFFGHSSPGTFDFNIDNPDNYENKGKYPLVLSLGCYSGNIFGPSRSIGERFTFYEDKAAVIFGASRGLGFIPSLATFARSFYRNIGETYYGKTIGEAMNATFREYEANNSIGLETLVEQFTINGDPAIRLHPVDGPDYLIDPATADFSPQLISAQLDSFTLAFDAVNLGLNQNDTITVEVSRTFPDGTVVTFPKDTILMDRFRKRLTYRLAVGGRQGTGLNTFQVRIDADGQITEFPAPAAELNNELVRSNGELGVPLFIIDNTARAVYPPEFALIGDANITLKASTTDALAPSRTYWLEIDTTARFDSPSKVRLRQEQKGGVLKWTPDLSWQNNTVYYWRVSPAVSAENPEPVWSVSSFTYQAGSAPGWRQGHYWQFREDEQTDLSFKDTTQQIGFGLAYLDMRVRNKIWDPEDRPGFFYNNANDATGTRSWEYINQGVSVVVFEPDNGVTVRNTGRQYGTADPRNRPIFSFDTRTATGRNNLMDFLTTKIPDNYIVFVWTLQASEDADYMPQDWAQDSISLGRNIFSVLEGFGAQRVRELEQKGSVPYAFIYVQGEGPRDESLAENRFDEVNVTTVLRSLFTTGKLYSKLVGPAKNWDKMSWEIAPENLGAVDTVKLSLLGIKTDGSVDTLLKEVQQEQSLAQFDAAVYPFLQLGYNAKDEANRSLPFLRHWTVLYEGSPELAINPALSTYFFQADTIQRGLSIQLKASVENLSIFPSDSVDLKFTLLNAQNQETSSRQVKAGLAGNGRLEFELEIPTDGLNGRHTLTTQINPDPRQLEHHYFNNILNQQIEVITDRKNPLLDVTFDGQVILNGDLVGASPLIMIRLKDENPYLLLEDTALVSLQLTDPSGQTQRIALNSPEIQYTPAASADKNLLSIAFRPTFTEDGTYQLTVNGRDVSGNFSGALDYQVAFEVRTRNSISNVLNYPNPFSTSTQFVYTLTGTPPTYFRIQILTVSGRIVREINQDEIGPLRVGTNRTDFAWDGTDEFGDRLANGVYLYRILAKDENGQDYESYDNYVEDTGLSNFFERGFGKMVLLR